jgi:sulfur-oxidizing protein SoxZ
METGYRTDAVGKTIPRDVIQRFTCRYNGTPVFAARMSPGIAANPYLRFFVTARESGTLDFDWVDDDGARGTAQAAIKVV